jgi:hypothetical protein
VYGLAGIEASSGKDVAGIIQEKLSGTVLAVPVQESRYLPDRRNLNRSFPGSKRGSSAVVPPQLGQKPRPLQEKATKRSVPQPVHRNRANPCASTPQRTNR